MPRRPTVKSLRKKAWKLFAYWIKERDHHKCITCSGYATNAGHFIHRDSLDFDEFNVSAQCVRCNLHLSGNLGEYALRLIDKYGRDKVEELRAKKHLIKRWTITELEQIIKRYE